MDEITAVELCFDNMVEELQKDSEDLEHDNNNIGETSLVNQLFIVVVAASFGFSLDSLDLLERSDSAVAPETNDKIKLLKKEERVSVKQNIDREAVVEFVLENTPKEFMPALFPDRMELWTAIMETKELRNFIYLSVDKYIKLYDTYGKGKDKYANLYLGWLDLIRSYTCEKHRTSETRREWALVCAKHSPVSDSTERTVISSILHSVQDGMQSQMSSHIATFQDAKIDTVQKVSDDTACYRISGWAVKSAIDRRQNDIIYGRKKEQAKKEIELLRELRRPQELKQELPVGAQFLDRGGLTFVQPSLLPWIRAVEGSIKQYLNEKSYRKYGKNIFKV